MKTQDIKTACTRAAAFVQEATELLRAREGKPEGAHPKPSGATRRASMELTRALAQMRRA